MKHFCAKELIMAFDANADVRCEQGFRARCDQTIQLRCINILSEKVKKFSNELLICFYFPSIMIACTLSCREPSYCKIKIILLHSII